MKFYVKRDKTKLRYKVYGRVLSTEYMKINHAIDALKKKVSAHRLVFRKDRSSGYSTLMFFEGTQGQGTFSEKKLSTLTKVGTLMYVPKSIIRKTTRKRQRRCKKSKNSNVIEDFAKSMLQDFNSHL